MDNLKKIDAIITAHAAYSEAKTIPIYGTKEELKEQMKWAWELKSSGLANPVGEIGRNDFLYASVKYREYNIHYILID